MYGYLFNNLKEGRLSEDDARKIMARVKEGEDVGDVLGEDEEDENFILSRPRISVDTERSTFPSNNSRRLNHDDRHTIDSRVD